MSSQLQRDAHNTLWSEIWAGRMERADSCEQCGDSPKMDAIQAHHDDYAKPLDVRWLCRSCHQKHHWALRKVERVST